MRKTVLLIFALLFSLSALSQKRKVQNRPYIDQRKVHYGFLAGIHTQDLKFVNNGFVTEDGESWFADVPEYNPGLTIGILGELYLNQYLALRLTPSLYFGDKRVVFREEHTGETTIQNVKSSYIALPLNLKYTAERFNNYRPYIVVGINPMYNLSIKKNKPLRLKPFDCYLEIGLGCDFYLPFFKLIPEIKFCFGLADVLNKDRSDLNDLSLLKYRQALDKATSRMIVLTFYFE